ncbi:PTS fructose transporter subunit IIB [Virgibacillus sp. MSJ-26]|uniref:PTS fructose transporter subunit IIB n=1 Tax=Virgibacillus sp. MSJ-26 TaxID=2841522 RepID=UPI001C0F9D89|nr:PTS fructose transporter subunit IIB [Virgibacillus sp. MSJ-26]MBU5465432.1 PTS fructose transporter subunit IIB [Virgibacillus sp. MSJ-26]
MIKILAACGAGINSSHQIKSAIEEEMKKRGHDVKVDAVVVKDINKDMMDQYDVFAPISKMKFSFDVNIPTVEAGPILYRIPAMADPVFDELENVIKDLEK